MRVLGGGKSPQNCHSFCRNCGRDWTGGIKKGGQAARKRCFCNVEAERAQHFGRATTLWVASLESSPLRVLSAAPHAQASPPRTHGSPLLLVSLSYSLLAPNSKTILLHLLVPLFVWKETRTGKIALSHHIWRPVQNSWNRVPLERPQASLHPYNSKSSRDSHPTSQVR